MSAKPIPETYNRQDWPRLVAAANKDHEGRIRTLEAGGGGGGGVTDGDKGDITVSGTGTVWTVDAGSITLAKQADMATASVVYRKTAGAGAPEVQALATLKTDLGLTGTNSGDQTITLTGDITGTGAGSFAATLATVNGDVGTFGSSAVVPVITVNGKGLVTAVTTAAMPSSLTIGLALQLATSNYLI